MKNKQKYIIISIIIVALLILILPKKISDAIQNEKIFKQYISNGYGVLAETFKVRRKGSNTNTIIRGVNGYYRRNWIRAYEITTPLMDKPFEIWIDNREHYVYGDNFSEVISQDPKFQHLYSEWIKKQVGIDDENVEFGFTGTFDRPYIEFDKITTLSEDYREIFENTHNFYCWLCEVSSINDLTEENKIEKAKFARENYLSLAMNITGMPKDERKNYSGHIDLSRGLFEKNVDLNYTFTYDARNEMSSFEERAY